MPTARSHQTIQDLLGRSNRLGADKRVTNFAGGNTSAKLVLAHPVTGGPTEVLVVKGSGGDLGTLELDGLALLDLEAVRKLEALHAAGLHEDDIVERYAYCRFGAGGAVPSIDTPLHAFVDAAHVDHLHPDSMIALAASADGPDLVADCYGDGVGWLDWKRPGFELGLALRRFQRTHPDARAAILGGHGMIAWADTSDGCEQLSMRLIEQAERYLASSGDPEPFGPPRDGFGALDPEPRAEVAARLAPTVRKLASQDRPMVASFTDVEPVLGFLASEAAPRLAGLGTSCPDHFLRTKVKPLLLDLPASASHDERVARLGELHRAYRADYAAYYDAFAVESSPPMRGADPAIVLVPGVGMWSFGADPQTARVAGEFYLNAINVMRGAEAVSTYQPISDAEKFTIEYWELEERKLRLKPPPPPLAGRVALVTGAASGIGRATAERLAGLGACTVVTDLDAEAAGKVCAELGPDKSVAVRCDVSDEDSVTGAFAVAARHFGGVDLVVNSAGFAHSATLTGTEVADWDRLHAVLARGSFLVSREAARQMTDHGLGGDIVHIVSKNSVVAGPANVGYASAKAAQAHIVRLLAAELGQHGIRVNGINPDAVVRGSGIFTGDWLEDRAEAYGVEPGELGEFYARRTLLGLEVLPEHVADGVVALVTSLPRTTGHIIPIDGGLAAGFLR
jgi:rhamnulose-1-phosphate aldolase/alcohol dehydrogenase